MVILVHLRLIRKYLRIEKSVTNRQCTSTTPVKAMDSAVPLPAEYFYMHLTNLSDDSDFETYFETIRTGIAIMYN
jgi:hypothetical protein